MKKINSFLIILLISAGLVNNQQIAAQTRINAVQETAEFKFTTWNAEWLSCAINGPTNDELQINNVVSVIKTMNSDVVALQEIGTSSTYNTIDTLVRRLGAEWAGSMISSTIDNCAQNQGIIYKKSRVQLLNASLITDGGTSSDWSGGRFPALYNVNLLVGTNVIPVALINIHAKAMSDATSYARRKTASEGLKALLDGSTYNTQKIILLGDFNDYLSGTQCSACSPADSPYKNFMDDIVNFKCLTPALYDPAYNSPLIDNIIISNELVDNYKLNTTTREVLATQTISNYTNTTSDHTPVSASFSFTVDVPKCDNIAYSETFAQSLGNFTQYSVSGLQYWYWKVNYGACVSGYANALNNPNEDWLISPVYDLSSKSTATLAFSHAINYCLPEADRLNNHTLWVSTNCIDGIPANASWTQLSIPTMPTGSNWTFVNSGSIQLPAQLLQNNVRFAFKYLSSATIASTWEIKDLSFNAACVSTDVKNDFVKPQTSVYVSDNQIIIKNNQFAAVHVYDISGRVLFSIPSVGNIEIPIYQPGVYMVRVGNEVNKVMLK